MDLLTAVTDGSMLEMNVWAGLDLMDFFMNLWSHQDYIAGKIKQLEEARAKK